MSDTQKIILAALAVLAVLGLVVGLTLSHYIGGFLRHVEREAQEQAEAESRAENEDRAVTKGDVPPETDSDGHRSSL